MAESWVGDESLLDLVVQLRSSCIRREESIRKPAGLTAGAYNCLRAIEPEQEVTCTEVAERIGVSPSRGSRIIDGLIRSGHMGRRTSPEDRRVTLVYLTPAGLEIRRRVEAVRDDCARRLEEAFQPDELRLLKASIQRIVSVL